MSVFLLALFLISIYKLKVYPVGEFNTSYLQKDNTTAINGIFVVLIVFSHYTQYADLSGLLDAPYLMLQDHLKQMVVSTFLFYSGYGMMESLKKKGPIYIKSFPKRFIQLLFRYDIAVCLFFLVGAILGLKHEPRNVILAFTSWTSIGNSNWYITIILIMYILIFLTFNMGLLLSKNHYEIISIHLLILSCIICVYILMRMDMPSRYYNTQILLPLGFLYSYWKEKIDRIIIKNDRSYLIALLITIFAYAISYNMRFNYGIESYTLWAISFIALVLIGSMKISFRSPILYWLGNHVFSIYILQRIPMLILNKIGLTQSSKYLSLILVFLITLPLAVLFERVTDKMISLASSAIAKLRDC